MTDSGVEIAVFILRLLLEESIRPRDVCICDLLFCLASSSLQLFESGDLKGTCVSINLPNSCADDED